MTRLEQALALAARGFHVFPIEAGLKSPPRIDDFPNLASRDPEQIRRWWTDPVMDWEQDHNIGVSTTRFGESEALLVIDVDNKGGKRGSETIVRLESEGRVFPDTLTARTPTGGFHFIYRTPTAVWQSVGKIGPSVDVRSFGGYIVAVGSGVREGDYVEETGASSPAPAPDWLVSTCGLRSGPSGKSDRALAVAGTPGTTQKAVDPTRARARASAYLASAPPVEEGERNNIGFRVANKLKDMGVTAEDCELLLGTEWRCDPPLSTAEISTLVWSAYRSRLTTPGSAAPEVQFSPVATESGQPKLLDANWLKLALDFCRSV